MTTILRKWRPFSELQAKVVSITQKRNVAVSYNILHRGTSNKPPIIIQHGLLGNKSNFSMVGKILGRKTEAAIISCDVRNHGESPHTDDMNYKLMSEDILEFLQMMKIDKCILLGHSLGGRIAMYTALSEPSRVHKLIVVDVAPGRKDFKHGMLEGPLKYVEALKLVKWDPGIKRSQARTDASDQLLQAIPDKGIRDFVLTNLIETSSGSYGWRLNLNSLSQHAKDLYYLHDTDTFSPFLSKALFLGGESSDYIVPRDYPEIERLFPNSIIRHIPDCGHWVHAEKPKEFVSYVTEFVNDI